MQGVHVRARKATCTFFAIYLRKTYGALSLDDEGCESFRQLIELYVRAQLALPCARAVDPVQTSKLAF